MADAPTNNRGDNLTVDPILQPIYGGRWAAHGIGWAVHADTRTAAIEAYWARVALYREVDARGISEPMRRQQTKANEAE